MKYALLILLCLTGCLATSKHVDKSEKISVVLFDHILKDDLEAQPVLRDYKKHVEEGSGAKISPKVISTLADGLLPGGGLLLTTLMGFYARKKHKDTQYITTQSVKAAKEPDKDKALKMLADDDKIPGYNG